LVCYIDRIQTGILRVLRMVLRRMFGPEKAEIIESCSLGGYEIFVLHFIKCNSYLPKYKKRSFTVFIRKVHIQKMFNFVCDYKATLHF